jgi:phage terminase large subunit
MKIKGAKKGPDSVVYGIKFLQDLEEIIIDPQRCPRASKEFINYSLEVDKNGEVKSKFPDKDNHFLDMCRYALEEDMKNTKLRTMNKSSLGI